MQNWPFRYNGNLVIVLNLNFSSSVVTVMMNWFDKFGILCWWTIKFFQFQCLTISVLAGCCKAGCGGREVLVWGSSVTMLWSCRRTAEHGSELPQSDVQWQHRRHWLRVHLCGGGNLPQPGAHHEPHLHLERERAGQPWGECLSKPMLIQNNKQIQGKVWSIKYGF